MMIRQACMRKMCEIEERIVVAQEKGRAGLIDVIGGCNDAMNLIEEEFDFDLGKCISRLQVSALLALPYSLCLPLSNEPCTAENHLRFLCARASWIDY